MTLTGKNRLHLLVMLIGPALAAVVLYWLPPERFPIYPRCLLYAWTGLQCPGCGSLRAAHHLLHGEIAAAFHLNSLMVLLLPLMGLLLTAQVVKQATGRDFVRRLRHPLWFWLLVGLAAAFAVARNLPSGPWARLTA